MSLVSGRRQVMMIEGPAPDHKCTLNISSFVTLPHLLDCLIGTRNSVPIVLLLRMMVVEIGGVWFIHISVWVGGQGLVIIS